jgi:hypothetical protein
MNGLLRRKSTFTRNLCAQGRLFSFLTKTSGSLRCFSVFIRVSDADLGRITDSRRHSVDVYCRTSLPPPPFQPCRGMNGHGPTDIFLFKISQQFSQKSWQTFCLKLTKVDISLSLLQKRLNLSATCETKRSFLNISKSRT